MKKKERGVQSWTRSLSKQSISELEALLSQLETQEERDLKPLRNQITALRKVIGKKRADIVSIASTGPPSDHDAGLPISPIISSPGNPIGDINLLTNDVPLVQAPFDRIIIGLAINLISQTSGIVPTIEVKPIRCGDTKAQRIIVKWEIRRSISMEELFGIEKLVRTAYEREISGHRKKTSGWESVVRYRDLTNKSVAGQEGIYFGPEIYFNAESQGVVVSRKFVSAGEARYLSGAHPEDWITRSIEKTVTKTEIELREGSSEKDKPSLSQDRFLELVTQISYLLAKKRLIERRVLMTAIYRELNRIGTNAIERDKLYGMKETLQVIERVLILPLRRPDLSEVYHFKSESVLLVGVPGIGKTFLAHYLMTGIHNAIFVSVDSDRLKQDLLKSSDIGSSSIFLRIDTINKETLLPVILILDDIDVILKEEGDQSLVSKFLNLMQGIRQRGFHVLASTNYPERIDGRLLEPGRLSKIIHVNLPDLSDRAGVLFNHMANLPFESHGVRRRIISELAKKTEGWTQRYLWELCMEAARLCGLEIDQTSCETVILENAKPITRKHFLDAYTELQKSINLREIHDWNNRIGDFVSKEGRKIGFLKP